MKALKECPVCHSKNLKQELESTTRFSGIIGGSHTSSPDRLNGSYCEDCGTTFKANVAGKCPICEGTGKMTYVCYGGSWDRTGKETKEKCWGCDGAGVIE